METTRQFTKTGGLRLVPLHSVVKPNPPKQPRHGRAIRTTQGQFNWRHGYLREDHSIPGKSLPAQEQNSSEAVPTRANLTEETRWPEKKAWDVSHSFMLSPLSKRTVKGHNPSMQQKLSFPGLSYKVNRPSVIFLGKSNAIANTIFRASPSFNFLETPSVIIGFSPPLLNLSPTSVPKYRFHFCVQRSRNIPHLVWQHLYFWSRGYSCALVSWTLHHKLTMYTPHTKCITPTSLVVFFWYLFSGARRKG